jgi:hypothetical protein
MLLDSLGIYGPKLKGIQRRLRTEPCKNARSACHTVGHAFKRSIVGGFKQQYRNERKSKTIDVAELYFKVKDFLEDFDPNNRADLHR